MRRDFLQSVKGVPWRLVVATCVLMAVVAGTAWGQGAPGADSAAAEEAVPDSLVEGAQYDTTDGQPWYEDAWTEITSRRGARLTYIFYARADTENDGVVIRVENRNDVPIVYDFTVIFRAPTDTAEAHARGVVPPNGMRTGESSGLFWIPFTDSGASIETVGVRGLRVFHVPPERLEEVKRKFGIDEGEGKTNGGR